MATQELRNSLKTNHKLHWYRIDKVLGQGGFGITYLAHDPNLDQLVAIKEYLPMELAVRDGDNSVYPASAANGDRYQWGLDRFITEARTLAKFKHPAIVRVLSVFEENNTAYMVMEYEHGKSFQEVLDVHKTLDEDALIPILAPLLDGLELIHASGFIHRDIKPANIYIREDDSPVLLDFGSARQALGEQTKSLTSIVSPGYAPFEQYYSKSDRQGPWTDIYSLAATMYRAISGIMPMDAIDRSEAILKAERDIFVTAGEIGSGRYSKQFMQALDHALNFNEKKRPQTIAEWRSELGIAPNSVPSSSRLLGSQIEPSVTAPDERETVVATASGSPPATVAASTTIAAPQVVPRREIVSPPEPVISAPKSRGLPVLLGITIVAMVLGAVYFLADDDGAIRSFVHRTMGAASSGDGADDLVSQGDRALAAGRGYEPYKQSAIDYYTRAIVIEPNHQGALHGIALLSEQMISATDNAIEGGDLGRAAELLEGLRALPGIETSIRPLELAYGEATARAAANEVQHDRIQEFLNEAATDLAEGRVLTPSGNNALVRYRAIQVLDPNNQAAARGIAAIVGRLTEEFNAALLESNLPLAEERLAQLAPLQNDPATYQTLETALADTKARHAATANRATRIDTLLKSAEIDMSANRLATPAGRNALERYEAVLELEPDNTAALSGIEKVATRYISLAAGAVKERRLDRARDFVTKAESLGVDRSKTDSIYAEIRDAESQKRAEDAARALKLEQQKLAEEARRQADQERMKRELELAQQAALAEKRRRQEAEAKRLFELEQAKHKAETQQQTEAQIAIDKSTLVVEFDGFDDQLELYGLKRKQVRADVESRLQQLGYRTVLHHEANRSPHTRLFVVKFRANLNSASGVFSYAASLALYDHVPVKANSAGKSGQRPVWDKGTTGVAQQTDLARVREEYKRTMRAFVTEVGRAPGRL